MIKVVRNGELAPVSEHIGLDALPCSDSIVREVLGLELNVKLQLALIVFEVLVDRVVRVSQLPIPALVVVAVNGWILNEVSV